jgi:DAACS family dicarboxylate/amino acid:cation (Na+ or H+) symporter
MVLLQQLGIPPESLGLILGIDRLLDMCRTVVNVTGDLAIATIVSHGQDSVAEA